MTRAFFPASATLKALAAAAIIGLASASVQADVPDPTTQITQSGYSPVYLGVDAETATVPSNPATHRPPRRCHVVPEARNGARRGRPPRYDSPRAPGRATPTDAPPLGHPPTRPVARRCT